MSNIYIYDKSAKPPKPYNGNDCPPWHYVSIQAGGNGHSVGDGCGCDGINPETSIKFIIPFLLITVILLIYKKLNKVCQIKT